MEFNVSVHFPFLLLFHLVHGTGVLYFINPLFLKSGSVRDPKKAERNAEMRRLNIKKVLLGFRNKQVKAREHLLTGAYT